MARLTTMPMPSMRLDLNARGVVSFFFQIYTCQTSYTTSSYILTTGATFWVSGKVIKQSIFNVPTISPTFARMDPLYITSSALAFIEAATKTVNYAIAVKNAPKQVKNIIEQLRSIRLDLETYLGLLSIAQESSDSFTRSSLQALGQLVNPQDSSSPFLICFKEVEACIEKLTTSTESTQSKTETALRALKWPFKEKETQRMLASCASLRDRLHSALGVDHM